VARRPSRSKIYKEILGRSKTSKKPIFKLPKSPGGKKGRRRSASY